MIAGLLVSLGMGGYARVQKWCFAGGIVGFLAIVILFLATRTEFRQLVEREAHRCSVSSNAYGINQSAPRKSVRAPGFGLEGLRGEPAPGPDDDVLPDVAELGLDPVRRGPRASDFRRVFPGMFRGLWRR